MVAGPHNPPYDQSMYASASAGAVGGHRLPGHAYTRTLVGPLSANASRLLDEHRKPGVFFLFQDLSIRTEGACVCVGGVGWLADLCVMGIGSFRLRLRLMNIGACVHSHLVDCGRSDADLLALIVGRPRRKQAHSTYTRTCRPSSHRRSQTRLTSTQPSAFPVSPVRTPPPSPLRTHTDYLCRYDGAVDCVWESGSEAAAGEYTFPSAERRGRRADGWCL